MPDERNYLIHIFIQILLLEYWQHFMFQPKLQIPSEQIKCL